MGDKGWAVRDFLITRLLLGLLCIMPCAVGCQLVHPTPSVPVLVRDAETKEPVSNAEVQLWSRADVAPGHVDPSGVTGNSGLALVKADFPKEADVLIHASAPGYLPDNMDLILAGKTVGAPAAGGVIELFRGPRPAIELVVPRDVIGDVKVEVRVAEDAPVQSSRVLRFTIPSIPPTRENLGKTPIVHVVGGPILECSLGPEFHGLYADGTPMPKEPKDNEVVLRWVRSEGADQFFVVGTKIDQEAARRAAEKQIGPREKNGGGGGGGGGRGGRGGGMGPGMTPGGPKMGGGGMTPAGM